MPPETAIRRLRRLHTHIRSISDANLAACCRRAVVLMAGSEAPASATKHHTWRGGLIDHTVEVVENALAMAAAPSLRHAINSDVLITAAILHDVAKTREYVFEPGATVATKLPYRDLIRHVCGGVVWLETWLAHEGVHVPDELLQPIEHAMLAHHGFREWGSPIEPQTLEARILHYADMLSARHPGPPHAAAASPEPRASASGSAPPVPHPEGCGLPQEPSHA